MDINNLEPNSHKYRQEKAKVSGELTERHRVEKVISGTATVKKRSLTKRFVETFFAGDMKDVKSYLIFDVMVPAIKETINSLINKGTEMILFGESTRSPSKNRISGGTYVSYGSSFRNEREKLVPSRQNRMLHKFDDICFETIGDANQVVDILTELISLYHQATVGDFYDAAGVTPEWSDSTENYGWTDLTGVRVVRTRAGYIIDLPRCVRLN